ncbi:hypothetical protein C8R45DRAFT_945234 [Mycena sanguinolenta]|nr:hypothetical protein C8R45DRAFT_945234 [Mycena sanguinolenta]
MMEMWLKARSAEDTMSKRRRKNCGSTIRNISVQRGCIGMIRETTERQENKWTKRRQECLVSAERTEKENRQALQSKDYTVPAFCHTYNTTLFLHLRQIIEDAVINIFDHHANNRKVFLNYIVNYQYLRALCHTSAIKEHTGLHQVRQSKVSDRTIEGTKISRDLLAPSLEIYHRRYTNLQFNIELHAERSVPDSGKFRYAKIHFSRDPAPLAPQIGEDEPEWMRT